jgi:hypothetical protein
MSLELCRKAPELVPIVARGPLGELETEEAPGSLVPAGGGHAGGRGG